MYRENILILAVILTIIPGCAPTPSKSLEISSSPVFTPVTATASETPSPFPSPIPTLDTASARQQVLKLFETNNGCHLPCWWGIIPGKTKWDDALNILAPISLKIEPYY